MSEPGFDKADCKVALSFADFPNAKTSFPFPLAVDTRSFNMPLLDLMKDYGHKIDSIQIHVPHHYGVPVLPSEEEVSEAKNLAKNLALSFLVHVEPDPRLGHTDQKERDAAVKALTTTILRLKTLVPGAYTLELVPHDSWSNSSPSSLTDALSEQGLVEWKKRIADSLTQVSEGSEVPFPAFCIETGSYPINEIIDLINDNLLSFCLDIGTLFRNQANISEHIELFIHRTKLFHLHGMSPNGELHSNLEHFPFDHTVGFLGTLTSAHYLGSVCVEVRFLQDLAASLLQMDKAYRTMRGYI